MDHENDNNLDEEPDDDFFENFFDDDALEAIGRVWNDTEDNSHCSVIGRHVADNEHEKSSSQCPVHGSYCNEKCDSSKKGNVIDCGVKTTNDGALQQSILALPVHQDSDITESVEDSKLLSVSDVRNLSPKVPSDIVKEVAQLITPLLKCSSLEGAKLSDQNGTYGSKLNSLNHAEIISRDCKSISSSDITVNCSKELLSDSVESCKRGTKHYSSITNVEPADHSLDDVSNLPCSTAEKGKIHINLKSKPLKVTVTPVTNSSKETGVRSDSELEDSSLAVSACLDQSSSAMILNEKQIPVQDEEAKSQNQASSSSDIIGSVSAQCKRMNRQGEICVLSSNSSDVPSCEQQLILLPSDKVASTLNSDSNLIVCAENEESSLKYKKKKRKRSSRSKSPCLKLSKFDSSDTVKSKHKSSFSTLVGSVPQQCKENSVPSVNSNDHPASKTESALPCTDEVASLSNCHTNLSDYENKRLSSKFKKKKKKRSSRSKSPSSNGPKLDSSNTTRTEIIPSQKSLTSVTGSFGTVLQQCERVKSPGELSISSSNSNDVQDTNLMACSEIEKRFSKHKSKKRKRSSRSKSPSPRRSKDSLYATRSARKSKQEKLKRRRRIRGRSPGVSEKSFSISPLSGDQRISYRARSRSRSGSGSPFQSRAKLRQRFNLYHSSRNYRRSKSRSPKPSRHKRWKSRSPKPCRPRSPCPSSYHQRSSKTLRSSRRLSRSSSHSSRSRSRSPFINEINRLKQKWAEEDKARQAVIQPPPPGYSYGDTVCDFLPKMSSWNTNITHMVSDEVSISVESVQVHSTVFNASSSIEYMCPPPMLDYPPPTSVVPLHPPDDQSNFSPQASEHFHSIPNSIEGAGTQVHLLNTGIPPPLSNHVHPTASMNDMVHATPGFLDPSSSERTFGAEQQLPLRRQLSILKSSVVNSQNQIRRPTKCMDDAQVLYEQIEGHSSLQEVSNEHFQPLQKLPENPTSPGTSTNLCPQQTPRTTPTHLKSLLQVAADLGIHPPSLKECDAYSHEVNKDNSSSNNIDYESVDTCLEGHLEDGPVEYDSDIVEVEPPAKPLPELICLSGDDAGNDEMDQTEIYDIANELNKIQKDSQEELSKLEAKAKRKARKKKQQVKPSVTPKIAMDNILKDCHEVIGSLGVGRFIVIEHEIAVEKYTENPTKESNSVLWKNTCRVQLPFTAPPPPEQIPCKRDVCTNTPSILSLDTSTSTENVNVKDSSVQTDIIPCPLCLQPNDLSSQLAELEAHLEKLKKERDALLSLIQGSTKQLDVLQLPGVIKSTQVSACDYSHVLGNNSLSHNIPPSSVLQAPSPERGRSLFPHGLPQNPVLSYEYHHSSSVPTEVIPHVTFDNIA